MHHKKRRRDPLVRNTHNLGGHFDALRPFTEELCQRFNDLPDEQRPAYVLTLEIVAETLRRSMTGQLPGAQVTMIATLPGESKPSPA